MYESLASYYSRGEEIAGRSGPESGQVDRGWTVQVPNPFVLVSSPFVSTAKEIGPDVRLPILWASPRLSYAMDTGTGGCLPRKITHCPQFLSLARTFIVAIVS